MAQILPTTRLSAVNERVRQYLDQAAANNGVRAQDFLVYRNQLQLYKPLAASQATYTFDLFSNNNNTDLPIETRLNSNSLFIIDSWSIVGGRYVNPDYLTIPFQTYNNETFYTGASEALAIRSVWMGSKWSLTTANVVRLDKVPGEQSYYAPFRQTTAATQQPEYVGDDYGWVDLDPLPVIDGQEQNKVTLTLGPGTLSALTATAGNYLLFRFRGFEIVDGAKAAKNWLKNA